MAPLVGLEPTTCGLTVRRSTDWAKEESLCWHHLSSRQITLQLLSAQMSLTSVFGMGTGGPSSQSIPTRMDGVYPIVYVKSLSASNSIRIIAPEVKTVKCFFRLCTLKTEHCSILCNFGSGQHWACFRSSFRLISISQLNVLPHLHPWPINDIVYVEPQWRSYLRGSFTLRCLQRLSRPHVATQPCPWQNNWYTRGASIPVLSY